MMMTPMILFRGRYSHAIQADVHYIPLEKDFSNADAILARLSDFEYLQGFADRAYRKLVQSGDYGYRSLARLVEDTIEEQYPLLVDPNWVNYRSQVERHWTSVHRSAEREMDEAPSAAFGEKPTELPLGLSEFDKSRSKALPFARMAVTRRVWRLIPAAQQHRLIGWVHKLAADQDQGRPLPLGLALLRRLWQLLPKRVRRGIVSPFL